MRYTPTRRSYDLFDGMFDDFFNTSFVSTNNAMRTDIHENENGYTLDIELAGYKKEDVNIDLEDGYLTVSAKHETTDEERDAKGSVVKNERYFGSCSRMSRRSTRRRLSLLSKDIKRLAEASFLYDLFC